MKARPAHHPNPGEIWLSPKGTPYEVFAYASNREFPHSKSLIVKHGDTWHVIGLGAFLEKYTKRAE